MAAIWLLLLATSPRHLLLVNQRLRLVEFPSIEIGPVKGITQTLIRWSLLLWFFEFLPRVLDDWVRHHRTQMRDGFTHLATVRRRINFYAVNMQIDDAAVDDVNSRDREQRIKALLSAAIAQSRAVVIAGEGGIGKTSLACWLGIEALRCNDPPQPNSCEQLLAAHPILPVLFDVDLPEAETVKAALRSRVGNLVGSDVSESLLLRLVSTNRVLVIVDGLSEKTASTQQKFLVQDPDCPIRRVIITSRTRDLPLNRPVTGSLASCT
jgi:hypothetical protein